MPRAALFIISLVLLALAPLGGSAAAAPAVAAPPGAALVPFELEEELDAELEGDECIEAEEELEAGELNDDEAAEICTEVEVEGEEGRRAADGATAPRQCPLRSLDPHAALDRRGEKLKLTIGYTTNEPTKVKIEISKGADRIASLIRHLGRSGVLRFTKKLGAKIGGRLVVTIKLPSTRSAGCPSRRLVLFPR